MKRRILSILMTACILIGVVSASAAEQYVPRASHYFDGYLLGLTPLGNRRMGLTFGVMGMGDMEKIGAYSITIEEEIYKDAWHPINTIYGDEDPETFYSYDAYDHLGYFTFVGAPNVNYRAVMVAYAENSNGHEYSDDVVCTPKTCE